MQVSLLFLALAVALSASAAPSVPQNHHGRDANGTQNSGGVGGLNGTNGGVNVANNTGSDTNTTIGDAGNSTIGAGAAGNSTTGAAGNSTDSGDPQTSLTLDPAVIAAGFANDGQDVPTAGQVASLTSTNNFINFCLTQPDLPITNGQQIKTGSCNPAPMGLIPSTDNMPSAKFVNPANGAVIQASSSFTIALALKNMEAGFFTNAAESYYSAPQQLNPQGQIQGHSHVVIEQLDSLGQTAPTDPNVFAFFKGLNAPLNNGQLTADVPGGLPPGAYRMATINTAANHQPVLVPVAQHGSLDDAVYFTVTEDGQPLANNSSAAGGNGNDGAQNATSTSDSSSATDDASATDSASATDNASATDTTSATDSAQPSATDSAQPSATDSAQPSATDSAQPSATDSAQPSVTDSAQPSATDNANANGNDGNNGDNGNSRNGGDGGNKNNNGRRGNNNSRGRRRLNRLWGALL